MTDLAAPADEAGIVDAVLSAHDANEPLLVAGQGSKAGWLRPVQSARGLSTRNLTGITLYAPQELIISARAGTPLAEIEAAVAERGQHIIAEPPNLSAIFGVEAPQTIGEVVATNLSGPRRVAWGAMRDHVMGVRAVNGTAEMIHSGGRVLKNVTGLDLCKLLAGSHGTLAVMTEITLKVLPAPECQGTLVLRGLNPVTAVAAMSAALGSPYAVSGAAYLPAPAAAGLPGAGGASVTLLRIEDFTASVEYRTGKLRSDLGHFGPAELLDVEESRSAWTFVRDAAPFAGGTGAVWRVSVRPSAGPSVIDAVVAVFDARWFMDWGGGLVWIAGPATEAAHRAVATAAATARGTFALLHGPEPLRAAVDVIPAEAPPLAAITRRVKAAFDPRGIFNPGRMYAGL